VRKRTLAVGLAVLLAAGAAGGAFAASQSSSSPQQAFLNDVARRLHVTPAQLTNALKQAMIDRLHAAVRMGRLTKAQAGELGQRILRGGGIPFGPLPFGMLQAVPGPFGRGFAPLGPGPRGFLPPPILGLPAITAAASYLGLSPQQVFKQLASGRSLAQIARAQGRSAKGLERALITAVEDRLRAAVRAGRIPAAAEQRILQILSQHIRAIVSLKPPPGGFLPPARLRLFMRPGERRFRGWPGPAGFALPGVLGGAPPPMPGYQPS
jgi:hypothetical protein